MSRYGTVKIGRLSIRENYEVSEENSDGVMLMSLAGQESSPRISLTDMNRRREDILNLRGRFVNVTFSQKDAVNGYFYVAKSSAQWLVWNDHLMGALPWSVDLIRVGQATGVDLESKLGGSQTRLNDHAIVGERWNAPPIGHTNYYSGSTIATLVDRTGSEGVIRVYRNLAMNINPQWSCTETNYDLGRVRFLDINAKERTGDQFRTTPGGWELNNTLVRVKPLAASGVLEISSWSGGAWRPKNWDVTIDAVSFGVPDAVSILRNEPEVTVVRLIRSLSSVRVTIDVTLRRGSRFAELYIQTASSATIKAVLTTAEAGTAATGYVSKTADDANGNRYIVGSSRTHVADAVNGGISKAATVVMDVMIGSVINFVAVASGDAAVDLMKQYIGAPSEAVSGVTR
jgi:hypothetical protein